MSAGTASPPPPGRLHQARAGYSSPYALVAADPLAAAAAAWLGHLGACRRRRKARLNLEQEAVRGPRPSLACPPASSCPITTWSSPLEPGPAVPGPGPRRGPAERRAGERGRTLHLGPLRFRPGRTGSRSSPRRSRPSRPPGVLPARGSLRRGPSWPPLEDEVIETARRFSRGRPGRRHCRPRSGAAPAISRAREPGAGGAGGQGHVDLVRAPDTAEVASTVA